MLLYNITIKIEAIIHEQWLQWMQAIYIPAAVNSNCFEKYQLVKLLEVEEDEPTYALQLYAADIAQYNLYIEHYLPHTEKQCYDTWGSDMLSFSTLMEVIAAG